MKAKKQALIVEQSAERARMYIANLRHDLRDPHIDLVHCASVDDAMRFLRQGTPDFIVFCSQRYLSVTEGVLMIRRVAAAQSGDLYN